MGTEGVKLVHAIRTRYVGSGLVCDLHVKVDPEATVRQGHEVTERVKARLLEEGPEVLDVVVHLEPYIGPAGGGPGRKKAGTPPDPSGTGPAEGPGEMVR
jgi:divalent metal cation (Fe/Co/Zn/Cd) transporter